MDTTNQQFEAVVAACRTLFNKKLRDYGASWRIMRPTAVTDQILIKATRIRSIETKGVALIDDDVRAELTAIVNYGIVGLIQLTHHYTDTIDMTADEAISLYDKYAAQAL